MKFIILATYFLFVILPAQSGAQNLFRLKQNQMLPNEIMAAQTVFASAENLLPQKMKAQFPLGIEVEFSLTGAAHGKALIKSKTAKIALNSSLVPILLLGEANSPASKNLRGHKTAYKDILATIIHETAHLYDYLNLQTPKMLSEINSCIGVSPDDTYRIKECQLYKNINTTISTNPYYLDVAGWFMLTNGNGDRTSDNMFQFRTPDSYELKNPQEHFAVNFEYFLLDNNYACRRPTLAHFFSQHFQVASKSCSANYKYVDPDATDVDAKTLTIKNLFKEIPLDRIYQVHYLLAEPGKSSMSKFGHSMIRLVICAPGQPKGPACLTEGLPYNLVLSYRAFINTPHINSISGLLGKYPSRLFVLPFANVIQEYNETEYRGLRSYPLNLSDAEIKNLVDRALETHWSYSSRYYFTSNNCAVETLNLLKSSLLRPGLLDKRSIYPNELRDVLITEKIASEIPRDNTEALRKGYYFDSSEVMHLQSYSLFFGKNADSNELRNFLSLPIEKRRQLYLERFSKLSRPLDKYIGSPFQLERYILSLKREQFQSEIVNHIWSSNQAHGISVLKDVNLNDIYQNAIEAFGSLSAPYQILKLNEYGIPDDLEIKNSESEIAKVRVRIERARGVEDKVRKQFEQNISYQEIVKIKELINEILNME